MRMYELEPAVQAQCKMLQKEYGLKSTCQKNALRGDSVRRYNLSISVSSMARLQEIVWPFADEALKVKLTKVPSKKTTRLSRQDLPSSA